MDTSSDTQQNWSSGIYKRFQIPSADHVDEAHEDIIYTIPMRGPHLVSGSKDKTVRIWNVDTQRLVRPPLRSHEASVICVQFDDRPEHDVILSGGADCSLIVWQFSTGEIIKKIEMAHQESILNLCFDDNHVATGSKDKYIKIWSRREVQQNGHFLPAYSELRTLTGHQAAVNIVRIHQNTLVSGSGDRTIRIWDIHTGDSLRSISRHTSGVACLQYNGRLIISCSSDNTIRIFDLELPEDQIQVACFQGHSALIRAVQVQYSETGSQLSRIVSGSYDETVKIWQHDANSDTWTSNVTLSARPDREKASNLQGEDSNRVFQVQFDDRRLLCCSQNNIISGWDFSLGENNSDLQQVDATGP